MSGPARRRVSLVEHQVDDRRYGCAPLCALGSARRLEGHFSPGHSALRAGNPLLHRTLADEKRSRDLLDRQAAYDSERQRDLLRCGQLRIAADKEKAQDVVAIGGSVELLSEGFLRVLQVGL